MEGALEELADEILHPAQLDGESTSRRSPINFSQTGSSKTVRLQKRDVHLRDEVGNVTSAALIGQVPSAPQAANPIGTRVVCNTFVSAHTLLRSSRMARQTVKGFLGLYAVIMVLKALFTVNFGVINGIARAVDNVKAILPHASIPGYILFISVISFLPAFMLEMAIFSQFFGQPAIS